MTAPDRDREFSAFVVGQRVRLVRAALLLTGGQHAEAEDLVQTVLTRLYVKVDAGQSRRRPGRVRRPVARQRRPRRTASRAPAA